MTTPRFDRLNRLANFLDDLPSDGFHMSHWASRDCTKNSCGTAGCAAGWAVTLFHEDGLVMERRYDTFFPVYKNEIGEQAFGVFFGLEYKDAYWITCALMTPAPSGVSYVEEYKLMRPSDITPRHAADRIRKVITNLGGTVVTDYPIKERDNAQVQRTQPVS